MKPLHEMTKGEAVERLRSLYHAQPKADWDSLAVGNIILHKGYGWRIQHVPPKRGFVMATDVMTGETVKLLRSRYDSPELLVTDEATLVILRTSHQEGIEKAIAAGKRISSLVQYDYPELFTPYPSAWDEKRREKAQDIWGRINEMRAFHDRQDRRDHCQADGGQVAPDPTERRLPQGGGDVLAVNLTVPPHLLGYPERCG